MTWSAEQREALTSQLSSWMEQHATLNAEHVQLKRSLQQMAMELHEATEQRDKATRDAAERDELLKTKQCNLQQYASLLMLMRSVEDTLAPPAEAEPAAAQVRALEQRCALQDAELVSLRTRLRDVEAGAQQLAQVKGENEELRAPPHASRPDAPRSLHSAAGGHSKLRPSPTRGAEVKLKAEELKLAPLRAEVAERRRSNKQARGPPRRTRRTTAARRPRAAAADAADAARAARRRKPRTPPTPSIRRPLLSARSPPDLRPISDARGCGAQPTRGSSAAAPNASAWIDMEDRASSASLDASEGWGFACVPRTDGLCRWEARGGLRSPPRLRPRLRPRGRSRTEMWVTRLSLERLRAAAVESRRSWPLSTPPGAAAAHRVRARDRPDEQEGPSSPLASRVRAHDTRRAMHAWAR